MKKIPLPSAKSVEAHYSTIRNWVIHNETHIQQRNGTPNAKFEWQDKAEFVTGFGEFVEQEEMVKQHDIS